MISDPIADFLTRIRNAQSRKTASIEMPYSKLKEQVALVLKSEGFIEDVKKFKEKDSIKSGLHLDLKYNEDRSPAIAKLERVSRPSLRVYSKSSDIKAVLGGYGIYVVSTSRGVMSNKEARRKRLGGEILCKVY